MLAISLFESEIWERIYCNFLNGLTKYIFNNEENIQLLNQAEFLRWFSYASQKIKKESQINAFRAFIAKAYDHLLSF